MINSSIIITAENKENTIYKTILSCLNQNYKNYEILIAYSKLKNENIIKNKFKSKKINFIKIKKKIKNNTQDQLYKIQRCTQIAKGENIFLLDGDDIFSRRKLKIINNFIKKKEVMIIDCFIEPRKIKYEISKKLKQSKIYKNIINDWPKDIFTSGISIKKKLIVKFFKEINIFKFKYLAIDILLAIYFSEKKKLIKINKKLTTKVDIENSVDKKFSGFLNYFYWCRRLEQHNYTRELKNRNYNKFDYLITILFYKVFFLLNKILDKFK